MVEVLAMRQGPLDLLAGRAGALRGCRIVRRAAAREVRLALPPETAARPGEPSESRCRTRLAAPRSREIARRCGSVRMNGFCSPRKAMRTRSPARSRQRLAARIIRWWMSVIAVAASPCRARKPQPSSITVVRSISHTRHSRSECARARCSKKPRSFSGAWRSIRTMSRSSVHSRRMSGLCSIEAREEFA